MSKSNGYTFELFMKVKRDSALMKQEWQTKVVPRVMRP